MQSTNIPTKIPLPFGYAAAGGQINAIPTASQIGVVNGRASLHDGFPPDTFLPLITGGVPPFGADFNGILNEITAITQWQQAGGFFVYDSTFSTTIGGYPKGAVLQSANGAGLWLSTVENNTTNPDTGGAGWASLAFEGSQALAVTTADVTVTQLQSAYPILIIFGALTAARNLILPATVSEWIIQNNTTGAFNLTVKTASGTGVTATQAQSTFLYGDGTNILFADSSKVASFNGRAGTVTLNALDVTNALGYVPPTPVGVGASGTWGINVTGNAATASNLNGTWAQMPAGTVTNFYQAAAPTGWVQRTDLNDFMLYIVSGAGGYGAGSNSPTVMNVVPYHTHGFTTGGQSANHVHYDSGHTHQYSAPLSGQTTGGSLGVAQGPYIQTTQVGYAALGGVSADHAHSGGTDGGSSQTNWAPRYLANIMCYKS